MKIRVCRDDCCNIKPEDTEGDKSEIYIRVNMKVHIILQTVISCKILRRAI